MANILSDSLLSRLSEFVAAEMGLYFPKERWPDLERGIGSAAREFNFEDTESCIHWLTSSPLTKDQIEILAGYLTVGETYFFRENNSFHILEEHILPELIRSRRQTERRIRIWSAGCCTGEEPYSIAILIDRMIPDLKDWNITILATDINPRFLQKASHGLYNEWSFRATPSWIKERYFKKRKEGVWEILHEIKKSVTFSYLNLAEDAYPSLTNNTNAMDMVLCRNVLMYFAPERVKRVAQNLYRSLIDGGWLIVSPSEASHVVFSQFATVNFPGTVLYQKDSNRSRIGPIEEAPSFRWIDEPNVAIQPTVHSVPEPAPEIILPSEAKEFPLKEEDLRMEEPRPDPYAGTAALYEQGRYAEASEKITELLSAHPDDAKLMALLAKIYANQGRLGEALEWCRKAIAADKLNPGHHYLLAIVLQEQGKTEEVAVSLKRALYLDPHFVLAHFALGNLALRQGRFRESEKHFENAISLLSAYTQDEILAESEGITAGRLKEIIHSTVYRKALV
jgi:chemotaxis protein methyltransferase CheR